MEKRFRQPVALLDQALDRLRVQSVAHDQKTVLVKGLSLLWFEVNEIQWRYPFSDFR